MLRISTSVLLLVFLAGVSGCGGSGEPVVANKELCLVEVAKKLLECAQSPECEKGVVRYAGYCYNEAPGDQLDICRGGQYFFEQPMKELAEVHAEIGQLNAHQRRLLRNSGELYCNYNFN